MAGIVPILSFRSYKRKKKLGGRIGGKIEKKKTCLIGVEIEPDYIKKFELKKIYDKIFCCNAAYLIGKIQEEIFDLVIMCDVLEHMKKSEGIDLLNFLVYRSGFILIEYPEKYIQNSVDGYEHEAHISIWNRRDFDIFDRTGIAKRGKQRLLVIQGYAKNS